MFKVGELIVYSTHGICQIDDICEKTYFDITKKYYVLHPLDNLKLSISTPFNSKAVAMLELLDQAEAKTILGYAVRFIHGNHGDLVSAQCFDEPLVPQSLRRCIDQPGFAFSNP